MSFYIMIICKERFTLIVYNLRNKGLNRNDAVQCVYYKLHALLIYFVFRDS